MGQDLVGEMARHDTGGGRGKRTRQTNIGEELKVIDSVESLMLGSVRRVVGVFRVVGKPLMNMIAGGQFELGVVIELVSKPRPTEAEYHHVRQDNDEHEQRGVAESGL
jgi:hypothetical protein